MNAISPLRTGALLATAAGCAWLAVQYSDWLAFERRNPDSIALCGSLTPGMSVADAEKRAHAIQGAIVGTVNDALVVSIPGQNLCVVEIAGGHGRSAAVPRKD